MVIPLTSNQVDVIQNGVAILFGCALCVIALSSDFRGSTRFLARVALRLLLLAYLAYGAFVLWVAAQAVDKPRGDGFGFLAAIFLTRWGLRQIIVGLLLFGVFEWALRRFAPQSLEWLPDEKPRAKGEPLGFISQVALGIVSIAGILLVAGGVGYAWKAYDDYRLAAIERRLAKLDQGSTPFERASYDPESRFFATVHNELATIWSSETHLPVDMGTLRRDAAYFLTFRDERGRSVHYAAGVRHDDMRWGPGIYSLELYDVGRNRAVSPIRIEKQEHVIDAVAVPGPEQEVLVLTDQALVHWSVPRGKVIRRVAHDLKLNNVGKYRHEFYHELVVSPDGARAAFVAADINLVIVPLSRPQDDVIELAPEQLGKAGGVASGVRKQLYWRQEIHGLLFSPDGGRLYVGRPDGLLAVNAATGAVVARTTASGPCIPRFDNLYMRPAALTEDGYIVVQTAFAVACVIDRHTFAPVREITRRGYRPIPDPDRIRFKDSRIEVTDLDTAGGDSIAVSANGARVAISSPQIGRTLVFDTATGSLVSEVCPFRCRALARERPEDPRHMALSRDGAILLVSGNAGHAAWDVATGAYLFALGDAPRDSRPVNEPKK